MRCLVAISISCVVTASALAGETLDARLNDATVALTGYRFDEADKMFTRILNRLGPTDRSEAWQRAAFGAATSAQHRSPATPERTRRAMKLFRAIVEETPESWLAPRSAISLGRIAELAREPGERLGLDSARNWYSYTIAHWPDTDAADEAALWHAGTFIQQIQDPASVQHGIDFLYDWLEQRPHNSYASVMWEYLAVTHMTVVADPTQTVACYQRAHELGLANPGKAALIYWRIAYLSDHELGDIGLAVTYYQRIILETPRSGRAYDAQLALARLRDAYPDQSIVVPPLGLRSTPATENTKPKGEQP